MNARVLWQRGADNLIHALITNYCGCKCRYIFNDFAFMNYLREQRLYYNVQIKEVNIDAIIL